MDLPKDKVFAELQLHLKQCSPQSNGHLMALCPFHEEKTPSFYVYPDGGYFCFGCKVKGSWVQLLGHFWKTNDSKEAFKECLRRFCPEKLHANSTSPPRSMPTPCAKPVAATPKPVPEPLSAEPFSKMHEALLAHPKAMQFLSEKRMIGDAVIRKYLLGVNGHEIIIPVPGNDGTYANAFRYRPGQTPKMLPWSSGRGSTLFPAGPISGDFVVLCEGFTDGLALESQTGLEWRTGSAGAGTWKPEWSEVFKGKHVVIAYDADDAGRRGAWNVAEQLKKAAASVAVVDWPAQYVAQGKDITDFLVAGITGSELAALLKAAKPCGALVVSEGRYCKLSHGQLAPVCNFTMELARRSIGLDGMKRFVRIINTAGMKTHAFVLEPKAILNVKDFRAACLEQGDFFFNGTSDDLDAIRSMVLTGDQRSVVESDHVGRIDDSTSWLAADGAVESGKWVDPDDEGLIWIGDKGYISTTDAPFLRTSGSVARGQYLSSMATAFGGNEAKLGVGWLLAVPFLNEIAARGRSFPLLFVAGQRRSGKTSYVRLLLAAFGMRDLFSVVETTPAAIGRLLAHWSCLPVAFDEYRDDARSKTKHGLLRSSYDRVGAAKGLTGKGIQHVVVRGAVLLSGEEKPQDSALLSRLVGVELSESSRNACAYEQLQSELADLASVGRDVLLHRETLAPSVLSEMGRVHNFLRSSAIEPRAAFNYSVVGGALAALVGRDESFESWLAEAVRESVRATDDESAVSQFLSDVHQLAVSGQIDASCARVDEAEVALWFSAVWRKVSAARRLSGESIPISRSALLNYLRRDAVFVAHNSPRRLGGGVVKVLVLRRDKLPTELVDALSKVGFRQAA